MDVIEFIIELTSHQYTFLLVLKICPSPRWFFIINQSEKVHIYEEKNYRLLYFQIIQAANYVCI